MTKDAAARKAKERYDRIAWIYDASEYIIERLVFKRWRKLVWSRVPPGSGLEIGVGTGKNIPFYPPHARMTAVDLSGKMLERARRRAGRLSADVRLVEGNVEHLEFEDNSFDWAVGTFVFCSVPNPVQGLAELGRVVRPGGAIYLLEHVRIEKTLLGGLMDLSNPLAVRLTGANINRVTVKNVALSGLKLEEVANLAPLGLVKLILARSI